MSIVKESNYVCAYCGLAGYRIPKNLKRSKNHFCNNVCSSKFRNKKVEVECDYDECKNTTLKSPYKLKRSKNNFCSTLCADKFRNRKVEVECFVCKKKFFKALCQIKRAPRHCCGQVCAKLLRKYHKDWGSRRSKLEIAIEEHFKIIFPFIYIKYNKTDIGYELDIFVPCLELAIELNGIFHYEPIFGEEQLLKTQETDRKKVVKCRELGIKLFVINVSKDKDNKKTQAQRISEVEKIVRDRIKELGYVFKNEQMVMDF